jgi:hypothetical protein
MFFPRREKQSHNTHHFETATVFYRWHPLAGQNLRVQKRKRDRHGEYIFVWLPDDTICGLPAWMFNAGCAPFISVAALTELRDLLGALRASPTLCDMASVKQVLTEVSNETSAEAAHLQLNLLLADPRPTELPTDKNEELVHALVELLLSAAKESVAPSGGQDESETD